MELLFYCPVSDDAKFLEPGTNNHNGCSSQKFRTSGKSQQFIEFLFIWPNNLQNLGAENQTLEFCPLLRNYAAYSAY